MPAKRFFGFEVRVPAIHPLLPLLPIQALLLFWHIGLLTIWTDELFTYDTVTQPVARILEILRADIHPPLYYLLVHAWIELPLPGELIERIRMFSAVWTLAATLLIDRLWLVRLRPSRRFFSLALWCLSPMVLLYGRMGRSYMMQTALAVLAVAMAWRFLRQPGLRSMVASAATLLLLLFTHYAPGLAIGVAMGVGLAIRGARKRSARDARWLVAWTSLVALAYLPWLVQMGEALGKWSAATGFSSRYRLTGSVAAEQFVKLGYSLAACIAGECYPAWVLVSIPVVLLMLAFSLRRLWRLSRGLMGLLMLAALLGYLGVAHWVSYPFIPARLLWLLPFFLMWIAASPCARPALRNFGIALLLVSDAASLVSYFSGTNFRNKTYVVPLREIAALIETSGDRASLLLVDGYNTDAVSLLHYLRAAPKTIVLDQSTSVQALSSARDPRFESVWLVRNTHDVSPHQLVTAIEAAVCKARLTRRTAYLEYEPWERAAVRLAGIEPPPSHFYQVTQCVGTR